MSRVVVVGAGVGGLAAAIRLAAAGHAVTLCEQAEAVGGKLGVLERPTAAGTFRFDTGPSLLTLPDVFAGDGPSPFQMIVAVLIAGVVGYAVIAWILRFVEKNTVYVFVAYRIALGAALLAALAIGAVSAT